MSATLETLLRFSRIAAGAEQPDAIYALIAETCRDHACADGIAVLEVVDDDIRVVADHGLSEPLRSYRDELDSVDAALGRALCDRSDGRFVDARVLPLMSPGALFGAVVLLYAQPAEEPAEVLALLRSLVDLATVSLGRAFQYRQLERAYDELRDSREAQARSYKLGALGQMAAGVAHDLKNILNPLSIHLQLLDRIVADDPAAQETIGDMKEVVVRGVETIDRLRSFSRQEPVDAVELVDLNPIVEEATQMARSRLVSLRAHHIAVRTELGDAATVRVQASELVGAVVNLVVNAIDAMQDDPVAHHVTVRTGRRDGAPFVEVEDDGPGMTPEVAKRVFEPFFSTKGVKGTGLGLANVYAFARRHSGEVMLRTEPGRGTTFTIRLPGADALA